MEYLQLLLLVLTGLSCLIPSDSTHSPTAEICPFSKQLVTNQIFWPDKSPNSSESKLFLNVSDYSGTTHSECIQKALDDVPEEGATIFLPKGVWIASNLSATSNTALLGEKGTTMARPKNATSPFLTFRNQSDFSVVNIIFDGRKASQASGILIQDCVRFEILDNTFQDISRNAIRVTGESQCFNITRNDFIRCDMAPLILFGSPSERCIRDFTVTNNFLIEGRNNGKIGAAFAANGIIANNTVVNCEHGIATRCISHLVIINNHIEDCLNYAFYLGTQPADPGSDNIKITRNHAVNCNIGISRRYGSQPISNLTLRDNSIFNNVEWDIHADFPAKILNNTLTSKESLKILNTDVELAGNRDIEGQPILPGDINNDLKIDIKDIAIVAKLFGTPSSDDISNPAVDIIEDGVIDMKDITFIAKQLKLQHT